MSAIFALLFLGLFGGNSTPRVHCPYPKDEIVHTYRTAMFVDGKELIHSKLKQNGATTTLEISPKDEGIEWKPNTWIEFRRIIVATSTDEEAVAFNKRVRECKTVNGEF